MLINEVMIDQVKQPFRFFCEEYHDLQHITNAVCEAYEYIANERNEPPTLARMVQVLGQVFHESCIERYILRPEEEYEERLFDRCSYVRECWNDFIQDSDEPHENDLGIFVDWYMDNHPMLSTNQELSQLFAEDIVYILKINNLYFHNLTIDYEFNRYLLSKESIMEMEGKLDFHINDPICEVW